MTTQAAAITSGAPDGAAFAAKQVPIEAYQPRAATMNVIIDATSELTRECMAQFGFRWVTTPSKYRDQNQLVRALGAIDRARVSRYGYGPAPGDIDYEAVSPPTDGHGFSTAEFLALTGTSDGLGRSTAPITIDGGKTIPPGGCSGQAQQTLFGSDQELDDLGGAILFSSEDKTRADPRVIAAFADWSSCMKAAGYEYRSPMEAASDDKWSEGGGASQEEIQTALKDIDCKMQDGVLQTWYDVHSAYERAAIEEHLEQLTDTMHAYDAAAIRAADFLGRPRPTE